MNEQIDLTICPITGKKLGNNYVSFVINDKEIRVCCDNCKAKIENIINYVQPICKQ
jgi:hypothetical protein